MKNRNFVTRTDSYKQTHWNLLREGLEEASIYFESRGGKYDYNLVCGMQYYIMEYLIGSVFNTTDVDNAKENFAKHFGNDKIFNENGWRKIAIDLNGKLPIQIKALPEGTIVKNSTPLFQIIGKKEYVWFVGPMETLLQKLWSPVTVASNAIMMRKILVQKLRESGADENLYKNMLVDFGYRGCSSEESAEINGAAFLIAGFTASDNWGGIELVQKIYGADMPAGSIVASEHFLHTLEGEENETIILGKMLDNPIGFGIANVIDSYNMFKYIDHATETYKDKILALPEGKFFIARPDSAKATDTIFGYKNPNFDDETNILAKKGLMQILWDRFGGHYNEKGFKVLNSKVKILQGDGISLESFEEILDVCIENGWCVSNLVFGSGGKLLQAFDRDTNKFAMKLHSAIVNNIEIDVVKRPITDSGKNSKGGQFKVVKENFEHKVYMKNSTDKELYDSLKCELIEIYNCGEWLVKYDKVQIDETVDYYFNGLFDKLNYKLDPMEDLMRKIRKGNIDDSSILEIVKKLALV